MLYNADKLFIGDVGNTRKIYKEGRGYFTIFDKNNISIVNQTNFDYKYKDVITNKIYINFHSFYCSSGDDAILKPIPLITYIQTIYENVKDIETISKIATKIIKGKFISKEDIRNLSKYLNNEQTFKKIEKTPKKEKTNIKNNENYIEVITNKKRLQKQAVGIDNIINDILIILAQDKKNPLLIGHNGVGKSTIINELAYRIHNKEIPNFLKNKKIIDLTKLIAINKYTDKIEKDLKNIIDLCIKDKHIIFIDHIDNLYHINNTITNLIRFAIKENQLKVIGITTPKQYDNFIINFESIKNFEKIYIDEPTDTMLYQIIDETFNYYSKINKISLPDNMIYIIRLLIILTENENRIWNNNSNNVNDDIIYNPELVIEIVDKIFAHAKVNSQNKLNIENFKYGINSCNKINTSKKNEIIEDINKLFADEEIEKIFLKYLKLTNI